MNSIRIAWNGDGLRLQEFLSSARESTVHTILERMMEKALLWECELTSRYKGVCVHFQIQESFRNVTRSCSGLRSLFELIPRKCPWLFHKTKFRARTSYPGFSELSIIYNNPPNKNSHEFQFSLFLLPLLKLPNILAHTSEVIRFGE